MSYEINYRQVEIPEVDAFLNEYAALCRKHGMQFTVEEYGYDGGSYVTLALPDAYGFSPNIDKADQNIPCIGRAFTETYAIREAEDRAEQEKKERIKAEAPADPVVALEGLLRHMPTWYWSDELHSAKSAAEKALQRLRGGDA